MFDPRLIDELDPMERHNVKLALGMLTRSSIFDLQQLELITRLGAGANDEDDKAVILAVRNYRKESASLVALRELGKRYLDYSIEAEQE